MNSHMPTLLELQRAMQRSLLDGVDGDASAYVIADGLDAGVRLGIYSNTCAGVLAMALRLAFPAVQQLVGPEFFDGAAWLFAAEVQPHSAWLDEYGADFPAFLARLPQAATVSYLADVARLEWQVNLALHAPDASPIDIARLTTLSESELARLRFAPHPAARLLRCALPVDAIWHAVLERDECAMAAIDLTDGPVWLLVHRTENGIDVARLSESEWRFTSALFSRQSLSAALEEARCEDAHAILAAHLARGCFTGASLAPDTFAH